MALHNRAACRAGQGDLDRALEDADRAVAAAPDAAQVFLGRSQIRHNRGDLSGAIDDLERAAELGERDPGILMKIGGLAETIGDLDRAVRWYERALEGAPVDWDLRAQAESTLRAARERLREQEF